MLETFDARVVAILGGGGRRGVCLGNYEGQIFENLSGRGFGNEKAATGWTGEQLKQTCRSEIGVLQHN